MPRSAATCAIGRPLSSANLTPRSSSSSGYFLGLDMTAENLLSPGQHPGVEVPAKPGPAHFLRLVEDGQVEFVAVRGWRGCRRRGSCRLDRQVANKRTVASRVDRRPCGAVDAHPLHREVDSDRGSSTTIG